MPDQNPESLSPNCFTVNLTNHLKSKTVRRNDPRTAKIIDLVNFVKDKVYNQFVAGNCSVIYFFL